MSFGLLGLPVCCLLAWSGAGSRQCPCVALLRGQMDTNFCVLKVCIGVVAELLLLVVCACPPRARGRHMPGVCVFLCDVCAFLYIVLHTLLAGGGVGVGRVK